MGVLALPVLLPSLEGTGVLIAICIDQSALTLCFVLKVNKVLCKVTFSQVPSNLAPVL